MSDSAKVAAIILAVGTELTTGQIINSNAAWLASQLTEAGLEPMVHWTVPDDRQLIREALDAAAAKTSLLIVTGGLGPTTDDFTRDVVANWLGQPLAFSDASWARLEERARNYGFKLGTSQKQQCWFPAGARIFPNPAGTADAFGCFSEALDVVVLPGPPLEIQALWQAGVLASIQPRFPERPPVTLYRWQCLGIGEGTLGEIVEAAVASETGLITGYRAHAPYIEVKLWIPSDREAAPVLAKVENAIGEWIVLRDDEDAAARLLDALPAGQPIRVIDAASGGLLATRLREKLQKQPARQLTIETRWQPAAEPQAAMAWLAEDEDALVLVIGPVQDKNWSLGLRQSDQLKFELFQLPWAGPPERSLKHICEQALMNWWSWLHEKTPQI